jgi:hypothetical protein
VREGVLAGYLRELVAQHARSSRSRSCDTSSAASPTQVAASVGFGRMHMPCSHDEVISHGWQSKAVGWQSRTVALLAGKLGRCL